MKLWYAFFLFVLTAALLTAAAFSHKKKTPVMQDLFSLAIVTGLMNVSYLTGVFATIPEIVLLSHGFYCASYVWLLAFFVRFISAYSGSKIVTKPVRIVIFVLAVLNTASLVANTFTHHAFTYHDEVFVDGLTYHEFDTATAAYNFHMAYSYVLALVGASILIYSLLHLKGVYRRRYIILLGIFVGMLTVDALFLVFGLPLDLNLFSYCIMELLLLYFVGSYIPRDLVLRLLTYASSSVQNAIACFDDNERLIYANPEAYRLVHLQNRDPQLEIILRSMVRDRQLADSDRAEWTDRFTTPEGVRWYGYNYQTIRDEADRNIGYYFVLTDKTGEKMALDIEKTRATHDPLTGLYNTEGFIEQASALLKADPETPRFMLSSNIRDFKLVNDLFGMEKGDEILVRIADLIREQCSEQTICGRLGADQFVMLIRREDFHEDDFKRGMNEVSALLKTSAYRLRIQLGVYAIDDLTMSVPSMYDRAKVAITMIRDESSSSIVYYSSQMMQRSRRERRIIDELEESILSGALRIYLQPQVNRDGIVLGAEALVRWIHTEHGVIMPGQFISVLEEAGLIYQLDLAVWEMACKQLAEWQGTEKAHLYISVNISPRDFYYIDLYKSFTELVMQYRIEPSKLHLEITESALMNAFDKQQALVMRLREYGFHVEIDDFGSGYSSLSMLKDLHVDALKIDMGFLRETANKKRARTILSSIVSMCTQLHIPVITEGVENRAQLDYLISLGCDCYQGYYFSRPLPVREFEQSFFPAHSSVIPDGTSHTPPQAVHSLSGTSDSF